MNYSKLKFKGAITEINCDFNDDGTINHNGIADIVDYQISQGISGLFINGMATEPYAMTLKEQASLAVTACKAANGRVPVMCNICPTSPANAIKLLELYEAAGTDAISAIALPFYPYTEDALYDHFSRLAKATQLPFYIYNAPQTGNTMSPALTAKIVNEHKNVIGYKDSTQSVIHLATLMNLVKTENFEYLAGSDGTTLSTMALGGCGVISFISMAFPKEIIEICDAYMAGDCERATKAQALAMQLRELLKTGPFFSGYKYAADLRGIPFGRGTRMPQCMTHLTDTQKQYIKNRLETLNLI